MEFRRSEAPDILDKLEGKQPDSGDKEPGSAVGWVVVFNDEFALGTKKYNG